MPRRKTEVHIALIIALLVTIVELASTEHTLAQTTAYTVSELSGVGGYGPGSLPAETCFTMTDGYARTVASKLSQFAMLDGLAAGMRATKSAELARSPNCW